MGKNKIKAKAAADHSLKKHIHIIRDISRRKYDVVGIERYIALFLCCIKFFFPSFWIRHFTRNIGYRVRNRCIEVYLLCKVAVLSYLLYYNISDIWALVIAIYILLDVVQYLLGLIFLSSIYTKLPSIKKNFAHLCINLFEITAGFALLYLYTQSVGAGGNYVANGISAFYFSLVTFSTIGYGDIIPLNLLGRELVIGEVAVSFLFIAIIVTSFVARLDIKNED